MNLAFYNQIVNSTIKKNCRIELKNLVLANPILLYDLIHIATNISNTNHYKAVWIIELIAETNAELLTNFTLQIINICPKYKHPSAVRGMARTIYFLATCDAVCFSESQKQKIIEYCLDGLISNVKVAPKVYNMYSLSYYAKEYNWINDDLQTIINKDYAVQSSAFKAAARKVLKKIKPNN